jgi:ferredoxin-type protein NapG
LKRRDFLRFGVSKAAEAVVEVAGIKHRDVAVSWIRPPFALAEAEFLQACTRCDLCIEACPHNVIFKLRPHVGLMAQGTPALDLTARGCHLCEDWPCVTVCEPKALALSGLSDSDEEVELPNPDKLAVVTINEETCLPYSGPECGACAGSCPVPDALTWEGSTKPVIDQALCVGCAMCREACIVDPKAVDLALVSLEVDAP